MSAEILNAKTSFYFERSYLEIWFRKSLSGACVSAEIDIRPLQGGRGRFLTVEQITDDRRGQEIYNTALDLLASYGDYPNANDADELHAQIFNSLRAMI